MSYAFKYLSVPRPDDLPPAKGPYLSVTLHGADGKIANVYALVDSGADTCAMPKSIAGILGLDLEHAPDSKVGTASESIKSKKVEIDVTIHLPRKSKRIRAPFNVLMNDYEPPVILGRAGFFENFYITFSEREMRFTLKEVE